MKRGDVITSARLPFRLAAAQRRHTLAMRLRLSSFMAHRPRAMVRLLRFARVAIHVPERVCEGVAIVDGDQRQGKQDAKGEVDVVLRLRRQRSGECARGPHHLSFGHDAGRRPTAATSRCWRPVL